MDSNSWAARLSSASMRYQSALQSRSGMRWDGLDAEMLMGFEEFDVDDDVREEYPCSFCSEYFDIVGLCCHICDEHPVEAKNGYPKLKNLQQQSCAYPSPFQTRSIRYKACPVCAVRVGVDMVAHITLQHGSIFKMQRKKKSRKFSSHSTFSLLRRELREGNFQTLLGGSSCIVSSRNAAPDPLLSSFILPMVEDYENVPPYSGAESTPIKTSSTDNISVRKVQQPPMSIKDREEKAKRSDFVRGLLLSTMLDE